MSFCNNIHQFVNKKTVGTSRLQFWINIPCSSPSLCLVFRCDEGRSFDCPLPVQGFHRVPTRTERFFGQNQSFFYRRNQFDGEMNMVCIFQQKELKEAPFVEKPKDFRVFRTSWSCRSLVRLHLAVASQLCHQEFWKLYLGCGSNSNHHDS